MGVNRIGMEGSMACRIIQSPCGDRCQAGRINDRPIYQLVTSRRLECRGGPDVSQVWTHMEVIHKRGVECHNQAFEEAGDS